MTTKEKIINATLKIEGGYVNDPSDSGGETNYGITIATARHFGYTGPMKDLSQEKAFEIYSSLYWDTLSLDQLVTQSEIVTEKLYDIGVNMGTFRAAEFLQRALNVLNQRGKLYPDIKVDGSIGPASLRAFSSYIQVRKHDGETVLFRILNSLQGAFYLTLAERREKDERFVFGWFLQRIQ